MNLFKYIKNVLENREKNGYEFIYILVDVHNTILVPSFDKEETFQYYKDAKEALQMLSNCSFIKLIMWTSSYPDKIDMYLKHFRENGIIFDYANENPLMNNNSFGCFNTKFFYDIGIDDKFGFEAEKDWSLIIETIKPFVL